MSNISEQPLPTDASHRAGLLRQARTPSAPGTPEAPSTASAAQQQPAAPASAGSAPAKVPTGRRKGFSAGGSVGRAEAGKHSGSARAARPIKGQTRFIIQLVTMLLFVMVIWLLFGQKGGQPSSLPNGTTTIQGSATAGLTSTATPGKPEPLTPAQVTANFLAAYFSWSETENDQVYTQSWSQYVPSTAIADLDSASPRLWLDNGDANAAKSPVPSILEASIQVQQNSAQVQANWAIQVIPKATENAAWETRQVQATIWLTQIGAAWFVTNITWQRSGS